MVGAEVAEQVLDAELVQPLDEVVGGGVLGRVADLRGGGGLARLGTWLLPMVCGYGPGWRSSGPYCAAERAGGIKGNGPHSLPPSAQPSEVGQNREVYARLRQCRQMPGRGLIIRYVRFTLNPDRKADIVDVGFVPLATFRAAANQSLFDHLVGAAEQR